MKDLIEALQILLKYGDSYAPVNCCHDELVICCIDEPADITPEDVSRLKELGFEIQIEGVYDDENEYTPEYSKIYSYRFGSC